MSTFMTFDSGRIINLDHVVAIEPKRDEHGSWVVVLEMASGDLHRERLVTSTPLDDLDTHIIPAHRGYHVLRLWPQDDGADLIDRMPVVAWRIDSCGAVVQAICLDDPDYGMSRDQNVLYPDGRVVCFADQSWDDVDAWLPAERERLAELERKRQERRAS